MVSCDFVYRNSVYGHAWKSHFLWISALWDGTICWSNTILTQNKLKSLSDAHIDRFSSKWKGKVPFSLRTVFWSVLHMVIMNSWLVQVFWMVVVALLTLSTHSWHTAGQQYPGKYLACLISLPVNAFFVLSRLRFVHECGFYLLSFPESPYKGNLDRLLSSMCCIELNICFVFCVTHWRPPNLGALSTSICLFCSVR